MAMPKNERQKGCKNCKGGPETFWYMKRSYIFDVDKAREITQDGREPVEVDDESTLLAVNESEINKPHIDHVNPTYPGIIAHVLHHDPDGELYKGHVLIDGHHRAARCIRENLPFSAYILSEEESLAVLTKYPKSLQNYVEDAMGVMA